LISRGCGTGVAVGIGVGIRVSVGVAAGEAVSVGVDSSVGWGGEAESWLVPQAAMKRAMIIQTIRINFAVFM
jgi:hypothetical protein